MDGVNFSAFPNLTGTSGADSFTIDNDGSTTSGAVSGAIDGLGGSDTLSYASVSASAVSVTLSGAVLTGYTGSDATYVNAFSNIDVLDGSGAGGDTLTGYNTAATWAISAADSGTYSDGSLPANTLTFSAKVLSM